MGKRKERRRAAMMAASRRVKLDLFAEPSGGSVSSSLHDDGGDLDKDHHAGVPSSPSSSGQKPENPLLLLEQYSDDELVEEASKETTQISEEILPTEPEVQVLENVDADVVVGSKIDDADTAGDIEDDGQLDDINNLESNDTKDCEVAVAATQCSEADDGSQPVPHASGMQIVGDLAGSWKVVMHEQSNQYYYWDTVTGETSWEVPTGLAVEVPTTLVDPSSIAEGQGAYPVLLESNIPSANIHGISNMNPGSLEAYGTVDTVKIEVQQSSNALFDYSRASGDGLLNGEAKYAANTTELYAMADLQPSQFVKYGQNLLERLKALEGCLDGHEWIMKEIEFRMSDCKALSSYSTSLLPFWWHTESRLKQLESVIFRAEVSSVAEKTTLENAASTGVVEISSSGVETHHSILDPDGAVVQTETEKEMPECEELVRSVFSSASTSKDLVSEKDDVDVHSVANVERPSEDVDMDVDMEVDDESVAIHTDLTTSGIECPTLVEPVVQTNPVSVACPVPLGEANIPPPPDEEWIPPPPPDSELILPPPPEDPPEPSCPPPYADVMPPPTQDQYSLEYALPSYEYYAPIGSEVTSLTYYVQADGTQVAQPSQPSYYEPVVSSSYPEVPAHVNQIEPVTYYDMSGGTGLHAPVVNATTSSGFYIDSGTVSYNNALDHASPLVYTVEPASKSVPPVRQDSDHFAAVKEPDKGSLPEDLNMSATLLASNVLANGSTTVAPPASNKNKPKVLRSKKGTVAVAPSLRSNKKVSSLVDKWKAAKEELHGDDDEEPEDALEILEKKRQKEIEEWRARQIASGEAQDNANFLPLGGDWRERVKRRRVGAKIDTVAASPEVAQNEKKQPDLVELSKDLPSGWQAYWDESSREVYYGNSITSETTWTRPTR